MKIRKRDAVISFTVLFGGIGLVFGCAGASIVAPFRGSGINKALLTIAISVGAFALFGAVSGLLFARLGDPPDEPPSATLS